MGIKEALAEVKDPKFEKMYRPLGPMASRMAHVLLGGTVGDQLLIEDLADAVGAVINPSEKDGRKGYGKLQKAIAYVQREKHLDWKWQRNERRLACLDSTGALGHLAANTKHIRSAATKGERIGGCVNVDSLSRDERSTYFALVLTNALARKAAAPETTKYLAAREPEKFKAPDQVEGVMKMLEAARTKAA